MQKQSFHNYLESNQGEPCLEFLIYLIVSTKVFLTEDGWSKFILLFRNQHGLEEAGGGESPEALELCCPNYWPHEAMEHWNRGYVQTAKPQKCQVPTGFQGLDNKKLTDCKIAQ